MSESLRQWIVQNSNDDVATALVNLKAGTEVFDLEGHFKVLLQQDIVFGHKFALHNLSVGALVHKYGEVIGTVTNSISAGEHVHVHNVESRRGRGDLVKEGSS